MNIIELAKQAGLGDLGARGGFIFYQPGTEGLLRFAHALIEASAQVALAEQQAHGNDTQNT